MTTLTRPQLIEALASAETNHLFFKKESGTAWKDYITACDLVEDGYAHSDVINTAWVNWLKEDAARIDAYNKVDTLKAQLLERDEIAAGVLAGQIVNHL